SGPARWGGQAGARWPPPSRSTRSARSAGWFRSDGRILNRARAGTQGATRRAREAPSFEPPGGERSSMEEYTGLLRFRRQERPGYRARVLAAAVSCVLIAGTASAQDRLRVASPDGRNQVTVEIRDGSLFYSLERDSRAVLLPS